MSMWKRGSWKDAEKKKSWAVVWILDCVWMLFIIKSTVLFWYLLVVVQMWTFLPSNILPHRQKYKSYGSWMPNKNAVHLQTHYTRLLVPPMAFKAVAANRCLGSHLHLVKNRQIVKLLISFLNNNTIWDANEGLDIWLPSDLGRDVIPGCPYRELKHLNGLVWFVQLAL